MDYKLELHPYSHVHPVLHFLFLNKVTSDNVPVQTIFDVSGIIGQVFPQTSMCLDMWKLDKTFYP
jgi:hypothetical protein